MNIQIFGTPKCFDTKKAQRYFKERGIKAQIINLREKPLSRGEFNSVKAAVGGYEKLLDANCKDKKLLALYTYLTDEAKEEKLFENQSLIKTPVVRNGRAATIGYLPEIWKTWE